MTHEAFVIVNRMKPAGLFEYVTIKAQSWKRGGRSRFICFKREQRRHPLIRVKKGD